MANWIAKWYGAVAAVEQHRGRVVIFGDTGCRLAPGNPTQDCNDPVAWPFPKIAAMAASARPDLVILLDAPAEVFFARKGEGTLESIELRRQEYLAQADMFRSFVIVDAQQPTDAVVAEVREAIVSFVRSGPPVRAAEAAREAAAGEAHGRRLSAAIKT
jgi:hypothetical protein